MKRLFIAATIVAATSTLPAIAADVALSVSIGDPHFYGRLDIGGYPPPRVIYQRPMVIERVPRDRPPVYLRVPPGHAKHWKTHCRKYNACGERVFFVRDDWYSREYAPRYQERHRGREDGGRDGYSNDHRGNDKGGRKGKDQGRGRDR